jgi:hypothetical protein
MVEAVVDTTAVAAAGVAALGSASLAAVSIQVFAVLSLPVAAANGMGVDKMAAFGLVAAPLAELLKAASPTAAALLAVDAVWELSVALLSCFQYCPPHSCRDFSLTALRPAAREPVATVEAWSAHSARALFSTPDHLYVMVSNTS